MRNTNISLVKKHISQLKRSPTLAINEKSAKLQIKGKEVYRLGFGQSPFPVPEEVVSSLKLHANEKDYLPVMGLPVLRQAISDWINERTGGSYTSDHIMVSPGSKELLFLTQMAFAGDLILLSPSWVSYEPQAEMCHQKVHTIMTHEKDGYLLQPADFDNFCKTSSSGQKILLLNYPGNPTGITYQEGDLKEIAEIAKRNNIIVLSDEIYGEVHHSGNHVSIAKYHPEGTIISTGLSKWCGAGGWRLGAFVFPDTLFQLRDAMATMASETYTSASAPIQFAAVQAFVGSADINAYVQYSRRILSHIGNYMHQSLSGMGVTTPAPQGGFYLFVNFERFRSNIENRNIFNSAALCDSLLGDIGVALLPGVDFGRPPEELTARLSYVDFNGGKAIDSLKKGKVLDDQWLVDYIPRMVKAMKLLQGWLDTKL